MKKMFIVFLAVLGVVCISVPVSAATSISFTVNNVSVTGSISYKDTSEYNPLTQDSVTATTTSKAAMDSIKATATIYYATGSTLKTVTKSKTSMNSTSSSVTSKASAIGTGYQGTGAHSASHNGKSKSGATKVIW